MSKINYLEIVQQDEGTDVLSQLKKDSLSPDLQVASEEQVAGSDWLTQVIKKAGKVVNVISRRMGWGHFQIAYVTEPFLIEGKWIDITYPKIFETDDGFKIGDTVIELARHPKKGWHVHCKVERYHLTPKKWVWMIAANRSSSDNTAQATKSGIKEVGWGAANARRIGSQELIRKQAAIIEWPGDDRGMVPINLFAAMLDMPGQSTLLTMLSSSEVLNDDQAHQILKDMRKQLKSPQELMQATIERLFEQKEAQEAAIIASFEAQED